MNGHTRVTSFKQRIDVSLSPKRPESTAELTIYPKRPGWGKDLFRLDRLLRNFAVVGAMLLTVVAVKNAGMPEAQSVFAALQDSVCMDWDESLGKLSFVNGFLPEEVRAVWGESPTLTVLAPMVGETVHAWTEQEPYMEFLGVVSDVRAAADGEVMSIAHGLDEERIVRVRHDDGSESIYGNLKHCYTDIGDRVYAGDIIACVLDAKPLAFELRVNGRSINPDGRLELPAQ